jgi:hypothetical protein
MADYDLAIRGGRAMLGAALVEAEIGIRAGRIAAVGERLGAAAREIDASDRLVLPGGSTRTAISTSRPPTAPRWPTTSAPARGRRRPAAPRR